MNNERRACQREPVELPLTVPGGHPALTRDISPQGVYFLVPAGVLLDRWLSLEYELPHGGLKYVAVAEVVRTEPGHDFTGIAVKLHEPHLLPSGED